MTSEQFYDYHNKVLLIDDFEKSTLNKKYKNKFLENCDNIFNSIIITCHSSFDFIASEVELLSDYNYYELLNLGHQKREELIKKWLSLAVEETIEDEELYKEISLFKSQVDTVIRNNILPATPINLLILIQIFEANHKQNISLTSFGHCYQELIYQALNNVKVKKDDYDKYFNVMTELAWYMHLNREGLRASELESFFINYEKEYLKVDKEIIIHKLKEAYILKEQESLLSFKYPYIFYFFIAKKVADDFHNIAQIDEEVDYLLENLHREDFANILIFITHHSKEQWITDKIKRVMDDLFSDNESATLKREDLVFIESILNEIPELVIEQRNTIEEREKYNKQLDEIDRYNNEEPLNNEKNEPKDILSIVNKTLKGIDISGQIIRNRYASLPKNRLEQLAGDGIESGLRFLDYFIRISDISKQELIDFIRDKIAEFPQYSNREIIQQAESIYLQLTYGAIYAILRKISASIGSKYAIEIFNKLEDDKKTPAYTLLKQTIELHHTRELNISSLDITIRKISNNPVCMRILREIVIQHIYMFPINYKTQQKLSHNLGISMHEQRIQDFNKRGKG